MISLSAQTNSGHYTTVSCVNGVYNENDDDKNVKQKKNVILIAFKP